MPCESPGEDGVEQDDPNKGRTSGINNTEIIENQKSTTKMAAATMTPSAVPNNRDVARMSAVTSSSSDANMSSVHGPSMEDGNRTTSHCSSSAPRPSCSRFSISNPTGIGSRGSSDDHQIILASSTRTASKVPSSVAPTPQQLLQQQPTEQGEATSTGSEERKTHQQLEHITGNNTTSGVPSTTSTKNVVMETTSHQA